jgi:hypothetical protein
LKFGTKTMLTLKVDSVQRLTCAVHDGATAAAAAAATNPELCHLTTEGAPVQNDAVGVAPAPTQEPAPATAPAPTHAPEDEDEAAAVERLETERTLLQEKLAAKFKAQMAAALAAADGK